MHIILNLCSSRPLSDKQVVPNLDIGNEADEELSISPNGPLNESDLESNNEINGQTEKSTADNEEIYFSPDPHVTHAEDPPPIPSSSTPIHPVPISSQSPSHFGTTTAFPVTNGIRNTHIVHHVTFSPNSNGVPEENGDEHHSNHLTIYNHQNNNNNNNEIEKDLPESVQLPLLRISNGINISLHHSDAEEEEDEVSKRLRSAFNIHLQHQLQHQQQQQQNEHSSFQETVPGPLPASFNNNNNDNEFNFSDCNIQVNLRNSTVKPSTALINKISTLTSAGNGSVGTGGGILRVNHLPNSANSQYYNGYQQHESSSEDDESVWYEYGCV